MSTRVKMQKRRSIKNKILLSIAVFAMAVGLIWLILILMSIIGKGLSGLTWEVFTQMTPAPNSEHGGLANAIVGSFIMVTLATVIGTPLGILVGIYLAEYGKKNWQAEVMRFTNDVLLSAPSIIIGLFVYVIIVIQMKNFSAWAGIVALALLQIPIIIRTTENMLLLVPDNLREAAFALGTPKWKMIFSISLQASKVGIITGVLLGVARIAGETAPLLFTSLSNQFWSLDLSQPMANLPVTIFKFALSPFTNWQELAWAGVFLVTFSILFLNIIVRIIFNKNIKK